MAHFVAPICPLLVNNKALCTVVISFLVRNLYMTGMKVHSLHYLNSRLCNRLTYCDWDKTCLKLTRCPTKVLILEMV